MDDRGTPPVAWSMAGDVDADEVVSDEGWHRNAGKWVTCGLTWPPISCTVCLYRREVSHAHCDHILRSSGNSCIPLR